MHLGILCHNYPPHPGGLEVMVRNVATQLARRGHRVTLVTTAWGRARGRALEDGLEIFRLPALHASEPRGVPWPLPLGGGLGAAWRALAPVELVHAHGALYATSLLARAASRRSGRPLVLTEHVGFVRYRSALVNAVERAAWATVGNAVVAAAGAITTYNERVLGWLEERYPGRRVQFVGNGVDTLRFRPLAAAERLEARRALGLPADETLVLFVGRESAKKNLDFALAARRKGIRLVICGARRGTRAGGARRRVPEDVLDLGLVPHERMAEVYGAMDLMINPSAGEGFPLALQEAMACGLPVALLWDPGYQRWLDRRVPAACDTLPELDATLQTLVADAGARAELGARARQWAESRWSWEATAAGYEEIFAALLEEKQR